MLRELFKQISSQDSPYRNIYYLTDTEIRFSINDITVSVRHEKDKYIAYIFEKYHQNTTKNATIEIVKSDDLWKWLNDYGIRSSN